MSAIPINNITTHNCPNRIKPTLLRDVKTEALLMFSRTALEGYFSEIDKVSFKPTVGTNEDTKYVYDTLRELLRKLQDTVVHVDYVINLVQAAKKYPELRPLAKNEEPLIDYYDVMANTINKHYKNKKLYLPEFLIICVLSDWILEEEKSITLYPFLQDIDFLELMSKFEYNKKYFEKDDECMVNDIFDVSIEVIKQLKKKKYKVNKSRASKTRNKNK